MSLNRVGQAAILLLAWYVGAYLLMMEPRSPLPSATGPAHSTYRMCQVRKNTGGFSCSVSCPCWANGFFLPADFLVFRLKKLCKQEHLTRESGSGRTLDPARTQ